MSKNLYVSKKHFDKITQSATKLFNLAFVALIFAKEKLAGVCEDDCIITPVEYLYKEADKLNCMLMYVKNHDKELEDIFY